MKISPLIIALATRLPLFAQTDGPHLASNGPSAPVLILNVDTAMELISFEAYPSTPTSVTVRWTTANEHVGSRFIIERSSDRMNWNIVPHTASEQRGHGHLDHESEDPTPSTGVSYYRLSILSADTLTERSDDFAVDRPEQEDLSIQGDAAPGRFTVEGNGTISDLHLLNDRGQFMPMELDYQGDRVRINAELLQPGRYYVKALVDGDPVLRLVVITPSGSIMG